MFVKVIREVDGVFHQSLYEVDRMHLGPLEDNQRVDLERDGTQDAITLIIDRLTTDFFVMNDVGKTIESYHRLHGRN